MSAGAMWLPGARGAALLEFDDGVADIAVPMWDVCPTRMSGVVGLLASLRV
jgi:hypothetical protein